MWKRDQSIAPPSPRQSPPTSSVPSAQEPVVIDLGTSVIIKGELSGLEDFTVCGQMEGTITLPDHTLTIGPSADIKANISARAVIIRGAVTGNVTAGERIEIHATGSVHGDIQSPRLVIVDGGHFVGRVSTPPRSNRPSAA